MPPSPVKIGVILSAHGVRGEVKIRSFGDDPKAIFSYGPLSDATGARRFTLIYRGGTDNAMIAAIETISDRNAAEALRGTELFVDRERLPQAEGEQWYYADLVGMEARLADGRVYGKIAHMYDFGAGDIAEIELAGGKTEMLPFKKPFITEVREDQGYVVIAPPEYMEEEKA